MKLIYNDDYILTIDSVSLIETRLLGDVNEFRC